MENLMSNLEINDNFTITGDKDQVIQFLLKKNESIICKKANFYYSATSSLEETQYNKILALKEKNKEKDEKTKNLGIRLTNSSLVRLKNTNNFFEYIGIYNGGKIITINPLLYKQLFIRYDTLLAFTDSIEFYENKQVTRMVYKFQYHENLFSTENRFYQVYSTKVKEGVEKFNLSDYPYLKEFVFLCSESKLIVNIDMLIEKRLGVDETMMIKKNSLFAFEKSVFFHNDIEDKYKNEYFVALGPGMIY
jgi:hypothetical protein